MKRFVDRDPESYLFKGSKGRPTVVTKTLQRHWAKARLAIGRPDLRLYDMRHSGLTLTASTGASLAEVMRRGGHSSVTAAMGYQHASDNRDKVIAERLGELSGVQRIGITFSMGHAGGTEMADLAPSGGSGPSNTPVADDVTSPENETTSDPLVAESAGQTGEGSTDPGCDRGRHQQRKTPRGPVHFEQPQRGSNPCLHLERVVSLASRRWGPARYPRPSRPPRELGGKDSNPQ
jgi:hypothetical protein